MKKLLLLALIIAPMITAMQNPQEGSSNPGEVMEYTTSPRKLSRHEQIQPDILAIEMGYAVCKKLIQDASAVLDTQKSINE